MHVLYVHEVLSRNYETLYRELAAFWTRHNGYIVASVEQEGQDVVYNHQILTSPHDWQTCPTMTD